ncbi:DNA damage-inducible transcript 3 protein [Tupaia chinensis]|uniref:DNA damage-inducible transcript 3 protein n=1 Tax=Tupaia chinensis TaxID=246437 RepID=L8Y2R2_TUPCH|nr:DNA damage-inducible transcript 3 protein [Tupaia chinensis]ELV09235.1 DNA damage-inducible transcript 3 protein [Tupaia chinensis]
MAAESLPFSFGTLSSWELEAWYEDLQEVLSSDENGGTYVSPPGNKEEESKTFTTLDPASLAWLTEEPGPAEVTSTSQSPCSPESSQSSSQSSPAQEEEEEDQGRTRKRKQSGQSPARAGKQRMKEKEQENERKVAQLAEENERLKQEIERLTREVEATRRALIDRMVNLHQS